MSVPTTVIAACGPRIWTSQVVVTAAESTADHPGNGVDHPDPAVTSDRAAAREGGKPCPP
jgi:hypothetical protein